MKIHKLVPCPRRGLLAATIVSVAVFATAASSRASIITWGAPTGISGDADVSTNGTLVGAFNIGATGVASTTVNGVTFAALPLTGTSVTSGNFTFSATPLTFSNLVGSGAAPFSLLSASYQALLSTVGGSQSGSPATLTMSSLVAGATYEFEWWSNTSNGFISSTVATAGGAVALRSNTSGVVGGLGQFAIGSFLADATNVQTIVFSGGTSLSAINGFQLRQTSVPDTGSTFALLGGAWLGFIALHRKTARAPKA